MGLCLNLSHPLVCFYKSNLKTICTVQMNEFRTWTNTEKKFSTHSTSCTVLNISVVFLSIFFHNFYLGMQFPLAVTSLSVFLMVTYRHSLCYRLGNSTVQHHWDNTKNQQLTWQAYLWTTGGNHSTRIKCRQRESMHTP